MSNENYNILKDILDGIMARLIVLEARLDRMDRSGTKKAIHVSLPEQPNIK